MTIGAVATSPHWEPHLALGCSRIPPPGRLPDTFDKLYLWGLVEYAMVAFFDADMLALDEPDSVFNSALPNSSYIGALGSHDKKYFQTGMMTLLPSNETFAALLDHFQAGVRSRRFRGPSARDGQVARSFFGRRFVRLSNYYSLYRPASQSLARIKVFHFRGQFKPWYDLRNPPRLAPGALGAVEFGKPYRLWWDYYERFHYAEYAAGREPPVGWGGRATGEGHPATHVWMQRYAERPYTQPRWRVVLAQRNVSFAKMTLSIGAPGVSCTATCASHGRRCDARGLTFTPINACPTLEKGTAEVCAECVIDNTGPAAPYIDDSTRHCFINYLHDPSLLPTCDAALPRARRLCVCLPKGSLGRILPFDDSAHLAFTHPTPPLTSPV